MQGSLQKQANKIIRESNYFRSLKYIKGEEHTKDLVVLVNEYNILHYWNIDSDNKTIFSVLRIILVFLLTRTLKILRLHLDDLLNFLSLYDRILSYGDLLATYDTLVYVYGNIIFIFCCQCFK